MVVRKATHDAVGGFPEDATQDDMGYVERLNTQGASAYYAENIHAVNSSRRIRHDGVLNWLIWFLPEHSPLGKLAGRMAHRKYGHY